jgi:hypothetical protein
MSLDEQLRTVLRRRAETHPPDPDLLAGVRRRERQRRRRRVIVLAAALAVAGSVASPIAASTRWPEQATGTAATMLVAPAPAPTFPVTPGWEPDWVGLRWFTYERSATGVEAVLHYEPTFPFSAGLTVTVGEQPPTLTGEAVQVGDRAATLATMGNGATLFWSRPTGWVRVDTNERVSREELFRYAASLADRPLPMAMPFGLATIPETAELTSFDRQRMVFRRPGSGAELVVSLVAGGTVPTPTSVTDGLALVVEPDSVTAYHPVDGDRAVRVRATGWNLTQGQVAAITRGVDVTPVALTTGG